MAIAQLQPRLLGHGVYDVGEIARLVRRSVREISGWANDSAGALLLPAGAGLFSFYDLVTAHIADQLRGRDVPLPKIREARAYLAEVYRIDWPLAHAAALRELASGGSDVYVSQGTDVVDAGRGGQLAFGPIVEPWLKLLEFDAALMASSWRPAPDVVIDPTVQAGAPCVIGTRVTTEVLGDLAAAGEQLDDLAADYDLPLSAVKHAVMYERQLAA